MKVKLLKEIRKRYSIERIDSIRNNSNSVWKEFCDICGFPFYYFSDSWNGWHNIPFKTYDEAYEQLLKRIKIDYSSYSTHGEDKSEKLWWIKK